LCPWTNCQYTLFRVLGGMLPVEPCPQKYINFHNLYLVQGSVVRFFAHFFTL
jgi:hypothetical protein